MKAGIYRDMDSATYFSDPCPEPSLSQSIAKVLIDSSPLHAKLQHPRLMPVAPDQDDESEPEKYVKAQAIGNAAHKMILGRGKEIAVLDYDSFRSKDAKLSRDVAEQAGQTVILEKHMDSAQAMVTAGRAQLARHEAAQTFSGGSGEVCIMCEYEGVWLRSLVDWLSHDLMSVQDYKSGGVSVAPHVLGYRMADQGWDIQAAMHERILDELDPMSAGRRKHRFIAQENKPPYALVVCEISEAVMTMGRKKLDAAIGIWKSCMKTNRWPCFTSRIIVPEYPGFKEQQWLSRELSGDFASNDTSLIMAG